MLKDGHLQISFYLAYNNFYFHFVYIPQTLRLLVMFPSMNLCLLFVLLFTSTPFQRFALAFTQVAATASDVDVCFDGVQLGAEASYCSPVDGGLLTDARGYAQPHGQCRVLCPPAPAAAAGSAGAQDSAVVRSVRPSGCTLCQNRTAVEHFLSEQGEHLRDSAVVDLCVARGACRRACGEEPPGCVYSGSCATLVCFSVPSSGATGSSARASSDLEPAALVRVTLAGPGSWAGTEEAPPFVGGGPPGALVATDDCGSLGGRPPVAVHCPPSVSSSADDETADPGAGGLVPPLADARVRRAGADAQCRALCAGFAAAGVEVVRVASGCFFCRDARAAAHITNGEGGPEGEGENWHHICVPGGVCADECGGSPPPGCVFSGTCASWLCFSDADTRRPAHVSTGEGDNGTGATVELASAPPDAPRADPVDPPAFAEDPPATPLPTPPSSPSASPSRAEPAPAPTRTPEDTPDATSDAGGSGGNNNNGICIASSHLSAARLPQSSLLFPAPGVSATVLCDSHGSCATPGHIVIFRSFPLSMHTYCSVYASYARCSPRPATIVNSPSYTMGWRLNSDSTRGLVFTALAARYGTRMEEIILGVLVRAGF